MDKPADDDFWQQYLVHTSSVMSRDSTKIAGARLGDLHVHQGALHATWRLAPQSESPRLRITLHHCIGGVVPASSHGASFTRFGQQVNLASDIYHNQDMYAFLEPLSAFRGEIIGGIYEDVMTVDSHTYGEKSIVILPNHRVDEFRRENSNFLGKVLTFDPTQSSIKEEVDKVMRELSPGKSLNEQFVRLHKDFSSDNLEKFHDYYSQQFRDNKLSYVLHNSSYFKALEDILRDFASEIMPTSKVQFNLAADQIRPHIAMMHVLVKAIREETLHNLKREKALALLDWQDDLLSWAYLFELEFQARTKEKASIFTNNPAREILLKHRHDRKYLHANLSFSTALEDGVVNLTSQAMLSPTAEKIALSLEMPRLLLLRDGLINLGFSDHAHAMIVIRRISDGIKYASWSADEDEVLRSSLFALRPSPQLTGSLSSLVNRIVWQDKSSHNQRFLAFINSDVGQLLQQLLYGNARLLGFDDLLKHADKTALLFADLDNQAVAKRFFIEPELVEFVKIVRAWMLRHALGDMPRQDTLTKSGLTQRFSAKNVRTAIKTIVGPLQRFIDGGFSLQRSSALHPWQVLIEQGCFLSWTDLILRAVPALNELNDDEFNAFAPYGFNLMLLQRRLTPYLQYKRELQEGQLSSKDQDLLASFAAREQGILSFIDDPDAIWDKKWLADLRFLVKGQEQIVHRGVSPFYNEAWIWYPPQLTLSRALHSKLQRLIIADQSLSVSRRGSYLRVIDKIISTVPTMTRLNN